MRFAGKGKGLVGMAPALRRPARLSPINASEAKRRNSAILSVQIRVQLSIRHGLRRHADRMNGMSVGIAFRLRDFYRDGGNRFDLGSIRRVRQLLRWRHESAGRIAWLPPNAWPHLQRVDPWKRRAAQAQSPLRRTPLQETSLEWSALQRAQADRHWPVGRERARERRFRKQLKMTTGASWSMIASPLGLQFTSRSQVGQRTDPRQGCFEDVRRMRRAKGPCEVRR